MKLFSCTRLFSGSRYRAIRPITTHIQYPPITHIVGRHQPTVPLSFGGWSCKATGQGLRGRNLEHDVMRKSQSDGGAVLFCILAFVQS